MTGYGVDEGTQDRLIAKLVAGERWDSFREGVEPVVIERSGSQVREVYADGSLIVSTVDQGYKARPGAIQPMKVSKCRGVSQISSVKYVGCVAAQDSMLLMMSFEFDYSVPVKGTSTITRADNWEIRQVGGTSSNEKITKPAHNKAKFSANIESTIGFTFGGTTIGVNSKKNLWIMVEVARHNANFSTA